MSPQARMSAGNALPDAGVAAEESSAAGPFVINLCSSTTPMALAHPDSPELKRFSFFVSRRREDNRERFRLHMGYFATLAEAEDWLNVIRDVYPGAWAGEAPGKKLRARAAAAALADELPPPPAAAARVANAAPSRAAVRAPAPRGTPAHVARATTPSATDLIVPTLQAAPSLPAAPRAVTSLPTAPALAAVSRAAAPVVPRPASAQPVARNAAPAPVAAQIAAPRAAPPAPQKQAPMAATPARPAPQPAMPVARKAVPQNALTAGSNVREVMAALDETGETRQMRVPPGLRAPAPAAPVARASASAVPAAPSVRMQGTAPSRPAVSPPARVQAPAPRVPDAPASTADSLSDTQVLKMLEHRRPAEGERDGDEANAGISLLKPDDTQTRLALKEAVLDNAPVSFAVQLSWSVQPVELAKVPPLAIFSAYTLYTVEGSREGRKWYGLRLGFFSDAISAKQVAYYVRSEFASVAVVPVSPQERTRASDAEGKAASGAFPRQKHEQKVEEFKLFDDDNAVLSEPPAPPPAPKVVPGKSSGRAAPAARKNKPLGRVRAKEQRSPKTLEETLEILGASDLEIDNGRGETLNDSGVRHLRVEVQKNTPFSKLLDRLSERMRKN